MKTNDVSVRCLAKPTPDLDLLGSIWLDKKDNIAYIVTRYTDRPSGDFRYIISSLRTGNYYDTVHMSEQTLYEVLKSEFTRVEDGSTITIIIGKGQYAD